MTRSDGRVLCLMCGGVLIADNQFDYCSYGITDHDGVVSVYHCSDESCGTVIECFTTDLEED